MATSLSAFLRPGFSALCAAALVAVTMPVVAAPPPITWGSPQTVSGDSDVDTTGTLLYAFTFGGTASPPSTTVNGVTFSPFRIPGGIVTSATVGNVTISESPGNLLAYNTFGSASAPFSGLSSSYQSLLGTGAYADVPNTITVALNGLTSGQEYRLQWWTNDSAKLTGAFGGSFTNTTASAVNSVTLDANVTNVVGGVGQFAIGTFTASGTTQAFSLTEPSGNNPLINALQVRAVPEPAMSALAVAAASAGWMLWRRRQKAVCTRSE
ncbi:MAG: hypothetical protein K8S94_08380 [Planctomycetia bacterium]|nr:hypothetical protein [Planctomycetia bacterium]